MLVKRGTGVGIDAMSVVSIDSARPHWEGDCMCLACSHIWHDIGPMGKISGLKCPSCSLPQGHTRWPFGAPNDAMVLICDCGSEALTAYKKDGKFWVKCMSCGGDLTNVFY